MKSRVLIAAGGTGGHIIPAIAVAEKIRELSPGAHVLFCGVGKEIERKLVPQAGFELREIPFPPFRGRGVLGIFRFFFEVPRALLRAIALLRRERIEVVVGFGGYPSFAPMVAALLLRIPRVLHEQNNRVGLANRVLARIANKVFSVVGAKGFPPGCKVTELSLPVRKAFRNISDASLSGPFRLLILGGSQGATAVNSAVIECLELLRVRNVQILHQSGSRDYERVKAAYEQYPAGEVRPFIDDVPRAMAEASLIISRAGAMSVAEITAAKRPAIYIPLAIAGGHQSENCEQVCESGAALLLEQDETLAVRLRERLEQLLDHPEQLQQMARRLREFADRTTGESESLLAEEILR